jgi:hypothetical protein
MARTAFPGQPAKARNAIRDLRVIRKVTTDRHERNPGSIGMFLSSGCPGQPAGRNRRAGQWEEGGPWTTGYLQGPHCCIHAPSSPPDCCHTVLLSVLESATHMELRRYTRRKASVPVTTSRLPDACERPACNRCLCSSAIVLRKLASNWCSVECAGNRKPPGIRLIELFLPFHAGYAQESVGNSTYPSKIFSLKVRLLDCHQERLHLNSLNRTGNHLTGRMNQMARLFSRITHIIVQEKMAWISAFSVPPSRCF